MSSGKSYSILNLISLLVELSELYTNFTPEVYFCPPKKGEVLKIDVSSDIDAKVELYEGLERTFKWFMEQSDG